MRGLASIQPPAHSPSHKPIPRLRPPPPKRRRHPCGPESAPPNWSIPAPCAPGAPRVHRNTQYAVHSPLRQRPHPADLPPPQALLLHQPRQLTPHLRPPFQQIIELLITPRNRCRIPADLLLYAPPLSLQPRPRLLYLCPPFRLLASLRHRPRISVRRTRST